MAADDGELFAVEGPIEVADQFRLEIGDLFSRRTVEILEPEIIDIAVAHRVDNAFAVAGEADWPIAESLEGTPRGAVRIPGTGAAGWNQETAWPAFPWGHPGEK